MDINFKLKLVIDDRIISGVRKLVSRKNIMIMMLISAGLASALLFAATKPHTFIPGATISSSQVNENFDTAFDTVAKAVPAGTVMAYAGTTVPEGYLLCDGSSVSRTTYSKLFESLGTTYGDGDGSTTFNLPDYRGVFLRGHHYGSARDSDYSTRNFGTYQSDMYKEHSHSIYYKGFADNDADWSGEGSGWLSTSTTNTGSSGGDETRPKNISVNYLIKH